jgi:sulfide:quinone oxidoreductase
MSLDGWRGVDPPGASVCAVVNGARRPRRESRSSFVSVRGLRSGAGRSARLEASRPARARAWHGICWHRESGPAPPLEETMSEPSIPNVTVVGTGFGGLEAAFYLRKRLGKRVRVTVVGENDTFLFKPNTIYIPFGKPPEAFVFPLRAVFERRHIPFVQARAERVDPERKVLVAGGKELAYDYLVLATGAAMRADEIPGLAQHASTIWSPEEMLRLRASLEGVLDRARSGETTRVRFLVPPKNKCSGPLYEMVMMLDTWLRKKGARDKVDLAYFTYEKGYIQAFGPRLNDVVTEEFARRGIAGHKGAIVERVDPGQIRMKGGGSEPFDVLVSFPPYVASTRFEGLASDDRGFLGTDMKTRQLNGQPDIYVVGDAGDFPVKQAFLALLQADAAAEHLAERVLGEEPTAAFDPVSMCVMEQFDKATFAQVPLRLTGDPDAPVAVREDALDLYRVGSGPIWRIAKKMLGAAIPQRFMSGQPFHAGASWAVMEAGVKVMAAAFSD